MKLKFSKHILSTCLMIFSVGASADYGIQCTNSHLNGYYAALVGEAEGQAVWRHDNMYKGTFKEGKPILMKKLKSTDMVHIYQFTRKSVGSKHIVKVNRDGSGISEKGNTKYDFLHSFANCKMVDVSKISKIVNTLNKEAKNKANAAAKAYQKKLDNRKF